MEYERNIYQKIEIEKELFDLYAKSLVPEIRSFYNTDRGKEYFEHWLGAHPEYKREKKLELVHPT